MNHLGDVTLSILGGLDLLTRLPEHNWSTGSWLNLERPEGRRVGPCC